MVHWRFRLDYFEPEIPVEENQQGLQPKPRSKVRSFLIEMIQTVFLALIFYFLIDSFFPRVRVENISMKPTLQPGELLLVNKLSYKFGEPHHGDVVVFHYPVNPNDDYIKRVIGVPGDEVLIQNGSVTVNGTVLNEPYISASPAYRGSWQVPENQIFVLGDNRNQSSDSHSWGFVPYENLVGKALIVYWPIDQIKILTHPLVVNAAHE